MRASPVLRRSELVRPASKEAILLSTIAGGRLATQLRNLLIAAVLNTTGLCASPAAKKELRSLRDPFMPPNAPDRALELTLFALGTASAIAFGVLALYVAISLELPQALWAFLPMLIMPCGFA